MALNRGKPSLFELMRGDRPNVASGSATPQAADAQSAGGESADEAEWLEDLEGHPIAVVDDEETQRIIEELGLTLIAEQAGPGTGAEDEVESPMAAVDPGEASSDPSREADPVAVEASAESAADPMAPMVPLRPATRAGGTRRIVVDQRRGFAVTDDSTQSVFSGRFLPGRGPTPRTHRAADHESVEQQSIFGPREEAESWRRLIRSDSLAAALGSAMLFLALAFLVGRVSARGGADQAGPGEAPAPTLARRAVVPTLAAPVANAVPGVPLAAVPTPAPAAPAVAPVVPADARPYHVRVVTTTRATAADLVKFLNQQGPVRSRGLKAYSRKIRSNTVVYIGSFTGSDDPDARSVCDFVKTVSFNGRQDFGGAVILRKV